MTRFLSPLRYPGGKAKQAKWIAELFPEKMEEFREVFVGGGSVFLTIADNNQCDDIMINDHNKDVMGFWFGASYTAYYWIFEQILEARKTMNDDEFKNIFEKYKHLYLIKNKMSFNGLGSFSKQASVANFTQSTLDRYKNLKHLMKNTRLFDLDFEDFINIGSEKEVYLYIDPPYSNAKNLYEGHNEFDHKRLAKVLKKTDKKWVLSYDNSPLIRELYKDFYIEEKEWSYSMTNNKNGKKTTKGKELIISNFLERDINNN